MFDQIWFCVIFPNISIIKQEIWTKKNDHKNWATNSNLFEWCSTTKFHQLWWKNWRWPFFFFFLFEDFILKKSFPIDTEKKNWKNQMRKLNWRIINSIQIDLNDFVWFILFQQKILSVEQWFLWVWGKFVFFFWIFLLKFQIWILIIYFI